jgi:site-specific DNA recombinase
MSTNGTAAIYTRISRDRTGERVGVQNQEKDCRTLAERLGLDVYKVYEDDDQGASSLTHKSKTRPFYAQMLKDARAGKFTHILAHSNSRLTRRMRELEDIVDLAKEHSITFHTWEAGEYDLSTVSGRRTARILGSIAAGESEEISYRQKTAFRHMAMKGEPKLQRQRPFGWEKDGKTIREDEAAIVRAGVQDVIEGKSLYAIARAWEEAGYITASGGTTWDPTVVKRILVGWRTAGVRTVYRKPLEDVNKNKVMGLWTPIITLEERDAAVAVLNKRVLTKTRQGTWLLTGLVWCGVCRKKMYGAIKKDAATTTYTCKNGGHNSITAHKLEWLVQSAVLTHAIKRAEKEAEESGLHVPEEPKEFPDQVRLDRIAEKIVEVDALYRQDKISASKWMAQLGALEEEEKMLSQAREVFEAENASARRAVTSSEEIWSSVGDGFVSGSNDDKRLAIAQELTGVLVNKGLRGRAGWGNDALLSRLVFMWADGTEEQLTVSRVVAEEDQSHSGDRDD